MADPLLAFIGAMFLIILFAGAMIAGVVCSAQAFYALFKLLKRPH